MSGNIYVFPEETERTSGRDALRVNIAAVKSVAQVVRTTLGPKGMDKMIVDALGDITVTNDGFTILTEMTIKHPAAKIAVEAAKAQQDKVGDGTTTAVILAGELVNKAEALLDQGLHPVVIVNGYRLAERMAREILWQIAEKPSPDNESLAANVVMTAMTGKGAESAKERLARLVIAAVKRIAEGRGDGYMVEIGNLKIEKEIGSSAEESELIEGLILDREKAHPAMPTQVTGARIALIDSAIEIKDLDIDARIQIHDPSQMRAFVEQGQEILKKMVDKIASCGVNVVLCNKGMDEAAEYLLAKAGILGVRRVPKSDLERLARATGARIVTDIDDLTPADLGFAGVVREERRGEKVRIFVEECKNPKAVTILLRAGTVHAADEMKRAVEDGIGDLASLLKTGRAVAGAGAVEMELSKELREFARSLRGKERLTVEAFADAMKVIPRTLMESAGVDPVEVLAELEAAHETGRRWHGFDVLTASVHDAWETGIIEPLEIKTQALASATEVAVMVLRIDDVIIGSGSSKAEKLAIKEDKPAAE